MRKSLIFQFVGMLIIALSSFSTAASSAGVLQSLERQVLAMDGRASLYIDPLGRLTFEDIRMAEEAGLDPFTESRSNLSFGYTEDVVWLRWRLQGLEGAGARVWWLHVKPTFLDNLTLYQVLPDGQVSVSHGGDHVAFSQRLIPAREHLLPVLLDEQVTTLYLRVETASTLVITSQLWLPEAYQQANDKVTLLYGMLFGLVLLSVLVSVLAAIWSGRQIFYLGALYLTCYGMVHFTTNGFDTLLLYPESPWINDNMVGAWGFATAASLAAFVLAYLQPRPFMPLMDGFLRLQIGVSVLGCVVSLAGYYLVIVQGFMLLGLSVLMTLLVLTIAMLRHRRREALLMLLLFGPGILAILAQVMRNLGYLPLNFWTNHLWALSSVFQAPFTAVILLMKVRDEERTYLKERRRNRALRQFFSTMAHELRTPVSILSSALTNLELLTKDRAAEFAPRFRRARTALGRLNYLIDSALAEDRLSSGNVRFQFQKVQISQVLDDVQALMIVEPPHQLDISVTNDVSSLDADPYWLNIALLNLLDNAVKYSPDGGPILLSVAQAGESSIRITVEDHGIGVPAGDREQIFERFFRAENAEAASKISGAGLGLYLVAEVVQRHGGTVTCEAPRVGGSRFTIVLPREHVGEPVSE